MAAIYCLIYLLCQALCFIYLHLLSWLILGDLCSERLRNLLKVKTSRARNQTKPFECPKLRTSRKPADTSSPGGPSLCWVGLARLTAVPRPGPRPEFSDGRGDRTTSPSMILVWGIRGHTKTLSSH